MDFQLEYTDSKTKARAGRIRTAHGEILTPIFMPVGTIGSVKGVPQDILLDEIEAQIILGNTYHLYLRPGTDILEKAGGLHKFISWKKPMLTDSGGFQVYSLADNRKIKEEGVSFRSHIDGSKLFFSPEVAIDIQRSIGADIIMAFDECTPYPCDKKYATESMHLTHRWLDRCIAHFENSEAKYGYEQALFPIVQGSTYKDLRTQSAEYIANKNADGNAIGGLSVGEPAEELYEMCALVCDILPKEKPRYLMGVGTPANLIENIALGVDMFDCVMPTRNGRNGYLFTTEGIINIKNKKWEDDFSPIDSNLADGVSSKFTKAYLRHLFVAKELYGLQIASIQNLRFYLWLMKECRAQIKAGTFGDWKKGAVERFSRRL